jgi:hypothetical protein
MTRFLSLLVAFVHANAILAKAILPRWDDMATKHEWQVVPRGWISQGAAPAEHQMVGHCSTTPSD